MKNIVAITAVALSLTAPAFADVSKAQAFFALSNDSAAERIVGETSTGDVYGAQVKGALANESAAERTVKTQAGVATKSSNLLSFFALGNDSAAERNVK